MGIVRRLGPLDMIPPDAIVDVAPAAAGKSYRLASWFMDDPINRCIITPDMKQSRFMISQLVEIFKYKSVDLASIENSDVRIISTNGRYVGPLSIGIDNYRDFVPAAYSDISQLCDRGWNIGYVTFRGRSPDRKPFFKEAVQLRLTALNISNGVDVSAEKLVELLEMAARRLDPGNAHDALDLLSGIENGWEDELQEQRPG